MNKVCFKFYRTNSILFLHREHEILIVCNTLTKDRKNSPSFVRWSLFSTIFSCLQLLCALSCFSMGCDSRCCTVKIVLTFIFDLKNVLKRKERGKILVLHTNSKIR
jgi:hypothetical protein